MTRSSDLRVMVSGVETMSKALWQKVGYPKHTDEIIAGLFDIILTDKARAELMLKA